MRRSKKSSSSRRSGSGGGSGSRVDTGAIIELFEKLRDTEEDEDVMTAEGVISMCESLELDPSGDVEVLIIAHLFNAEAGARFTRAEFVEGMTRLGVSSFSGLKAKLPRLKMETLEDMTNRRGERLRVFLRLPRVDRTQHSLTSTSCMFRVVQHSTSRVSV